MAGVYGPGRVESRSDSTTKQLSGRLNKTSHEESRELPRRNRLSEWSQHLIDHALFEQFLAGFSQRFQRVFERRIGPEASVLSQCEEDAQRLFRKLTASYLISVRPGFDHQSSLSPA